LRALYRFSWIHSINGTEADHLDHFFGLGTDVSLRDWFKLGVNYFHYRSDRYYKNYPDVTARNPMLQVFFTWNF
jgi:hypothetical protein